jgi:hypothetical protein
MQHPYNGINSKGAHSCPLSWNGPNRPFRRGRLSRIDLRGLQRRTSKVPWFIPPPSIRTRRATSAAVNSGQQDGANLQSVAENLPPSGEWDAWTAKLVSGATAVFLVLLVPQIIMNAQNMMHGNYAALTAIAWVVCPLRIQAHERQIKHGHYPCIM